MRRRHLSVSWLLATHSCLCRRGQSSCLAQAGTVLQTCDLCVCGQAAGDSVCVLCVWEVEGGDDVGEGGKVGES